MVEMGPVHDALRLYILTAERHNNGEWWSRYMANYLLYGLTKMERIQDVMDMRVI